MTDPRTTPSARRRRSSLLPTLLAGAASAGFAALAAGQEWASSRIDVAGQPVAATGTEVAPVVLPLMLVALACWGAVLVLRRRGRQVVAVLGLAATSSSAVAVAARAHRSADVAAALTSGPGSSAGSAVAVETTLWPVLTLVACVLAAVPFAVALRTAGRWSEMSSRYDAPSGTGPSAPGSTVPPVGDSPAAMWRALDEGRDPTG